MLLPSCLHHSIRSRMFDKHVSLKWHCGGFLYQNVASRCLYDFICPHKLAQQEAGMIDIPQVPICPERQTRNAAEGIKIKQVGENDAGMLDIPQVPTCSDLPPMNVVER